jgi:hypothetical protein
VIENYIKNAKKLKWVSFRFILSVEIEILV